MYFEHLYGAENCLLIGTLLFCVGVTGVEAGVTSCPFRGITKSLAPGTSWLRLLVVMGVVSGVEFTMPLPPCSVDVNKVLGRSKLEQ